LKIVDKDKIEVIPNAIDPKRFNKKDKHGSREKFNLSKDKFIVSFVGQFIERKGIHKLDEAIGELKNVHAIYAGSGKLVPEAENTLYSDRVHPDDLAEFYSSSDVFVLPTINEGCSNAIIE